MTSRADANNANFWFSIRSGGSTPRLIVDKYGTLRWPPVKLGQSDSASKQVGLGLEERVYVREIKSGKGRERLIYIACVRKREIEQKREGKREKGKSKDKR